MRKLRALDPLLGQGLLEGSSVITSRICTSMPDEAVSAAIKPVQGPPP